MVIQYEGGIKRELLLITKKKEKKDELLKKQKGRRFSSDIRSTTPSSDHKCGSGACKKSFPNSEELGGDHGTSWNQEGTVNRLETR